MNQTDSIYFLPVKRRLDFQRGSIVPVENLDQLAEDVKNITCSDGFIYSPTETPIFLLPASHVLEVTEPLMGDFRKEDGAFLIYLAAYLYGYRLQFQDWWVDTRISIRTSSHCAVVSTETARKFFSVAYQ